MHTRKNLDFGLLYLSHIWGALPHIVLRASAFISHIAHVLLHWKPQLIMFLFHALSFTSFLSAICSSSRPLCSFLVLACRAESIAFIRPCISGWRNFTEADTYISTFEQACHLWSMMSRSGVSGFHVSVPSVPQPGLALITFAACEEHNPIDTEWLRVASHVFKDHYFK